MPAAMTTFRSLTADEVETITAQGCTADDWSAVEVADGFLADRVRRVHFAGRVKVGDLSGEVRSVTGLTKPAGIYAAHLVDCMIGNGVRIANVGVHIAHYEVGDGCCIEDVGTMETRPQASFGNGVEVEVLNEAGGREVILFNDLDAQVANLMCLHRHRPKLIARLTAMAQAAVEQVRSDTGRIGSATRMASVGKMIDVNVGEYAVIDGAASLVNGTVLSRQDAPTTIGAEVEADDFIVAESSRVDGGAVLSKSYVGQACRIGKQFSAEGSLFFANCEGFHGETCSVFAGPYTVTHHKSTLLIAGYFSFYNAGSGTNQSNHMYKLGPVHEGKLQRGCKTGSFSYIMWPCNVGPFSVVLGKHTRSFDTSDFPFSHIEATAAGRSMIVPGLNLMTVGTVRDGAKWPQRDGRKGALRRDRISFDVLSPLTVGRMIRGSAELKQLQETTDRDVETVGVGGAEMKRVLLRTSQKYYRTGIEMYLYERVVAHVEAALADGATTLAYALVEEPEAVAGTDWLDVGGQLMPRRRLDDLCAAVENGDVADFSALAARLDAIDQARVDDEWAWVKEAYRQVFEVDLDTATVEDLQRVADSLLAVRSKMLNLVQIDAQKEFEKYARTGFGQGGSAEDADHDFEAVRGRYEENSFVRQLSDEIAALTARVASFKENVAKLT